MKAAKTKPGCAIVVCHPRPESFCSHIARQVQQTAETLGYGTIVRDLYEMAFDPALHARDIALNQGGNRPAPDVEQELSILGSPKAIVLVYPIWFGSPPGLLKGYVERVLGAGFGGPGTIPLAAGPRPRVLLTIATSGATAAWIERKGIAASAGRLFGTYLAGALMIPRAEHIAIDNVVPTMSAARGKAALERIVRDVGAILKQTKLVRSTSDAGRLIATTKRRWDTLPHPAG